MHRHIKLAGRDRALTVLKTFSALPLKRYQAIWESPKPGAASERQLIAPVAQCRSQHWQWRFF
jgi:hypothetical protein